MLLAHRLSGAVQDPLDWQFVNKLPGLPVDTRIKNKQVDTQNKI